MLLHEIYSEKGKISQILKLQKKKVEHIKLAIKQIISYILRNE